MARPNLRLRLGGRTSMLPPVILMTDDERLPEPDAAIGRLPPGSCVIFRHYDAPNRPLLARHLRHICRHRNVAFLVAADARLAVAVGADGLHLPENVLRRTPRRWRRWRRSPWLITASAHSPRAIRFAALAGADAVLLSPVFDTASHPGAAILGVLRFARLARAAPLPVYALGGVGARTVGRLELTPMAGFAGIGGINAASRTRLGRALLASRMSR